MRYLIIETRRCDLREDVVGYTCEDTSEVDLTKPIGFSREADGSFMYASVMHALASGWRLISQPQQCGDTWTWWLTDDDRSVKHPVRIEER